MEDIARQLDNVRSEMVSLLYDYTLATESQRTEIYEQCETLGGEVQELIGLLKLSIRGTNRQAAAHAEVDPDYAAQIDRMSRESLSAIHSAGQEVSAAVRALRESRPPIDKAT
jgi:hypothetical protein